MDDNLHGFYAHFKTHNHKLFKLTERCSKMLVCVSRGRPHVLNTFRLFPTKGTFTKTSLVSHRGALNIVLGPTYANRDPFR